MKCVQFREDGIIFIFSSVVDEEVITENNESLAKESSEFRKKVRGEPVWRLG